ncbi:MAG: YIP1 family protein [Desulfarculus sp.]|nr:YIP1 family protein [Desulfarculus sp.]
MIVDKSQLEVGVAEMPPAMEFQWRRPQTFFPLAMAATTSPRAFFAAMPHQGGWWPPLAFLLVAQAIPALVLAGFQIPQHGLAALAGMMVFLAKRLVYSLAFAGLIWLMARFAGRAKIDFHSTLRIFCYSSGVWIVSAAVPILSLAPAALVMVLLVLCHLYLIQAGLQVVANLPTFQAILSVLLAIVAFMLLWVILAPMLGLMPPPSASPPAPPPGQP